MNAEALRYAKVALPDEAMGILGALVERLGGRFHLCKEEADCIETVYVSQPMPEAERPGRMLKGLRLRADMTQKALAKAIGVPQSHVSEYETNKRKIPPAKAEELAKLLETVATDFLPREE